jgi:hypothetical protein
VYIDVRVILSSLQIKIGICPVICGSIPQMRLQMILTQRTDSHLKTPTKIKLLLTRRVEEQAFYSDESLLDRLDNLGVRDAVR